MPLLPSVDPADVWGQQLNDAIRDQTRTPMSHSTIMGLSGVEGGTLVPCSTHGDLLWWDGGVWVTWFEGTRYANDFECYLRMGQDVPVISHVLATSTGTEAAKWKRRWASCKLAGVDPETGRPLYKVEFSVVFQFTADDATTIASSSAPIDMILDLEAGFDLLSGGAEGFFTPGTFVGSINQGAPATVVYKDVSGPAVYFGHALPTSGPDYLFYCPSATSSVLCDKTHPFTWAVNDQLHLYGSGLYRYGLS